MERGRKGGSLEGEPGWIGRRVRLNRCLIVDGFLSNCPYSWFMIRVNDTDSLTERDGMYILSFFGVRQEDILEKGDGKQGILCISWYWSLYFSAYSFDFSLLYGRRFTVHIPLICFSIAAPVFMTNGRRKTEDGGRKTEGGRRKTEGGGRKTEGGGLESRRDAAPTMRKVTLRELGREVHRGRESLQEFFCYD